MVYAKNRNKIRRILYSWPILIFLLLIVLLVGKSVWGVYRSEKISFSNKQFSEKEYEELKQRSDLVSSEIEMLKTDKGIEMEIRDKFRVVKAGEQLAIIINTDDTEEEIKVTKESFWKKIWNFWRD